jgi:hypothetical protein
MADKKITQFENFTGLGDPHTYFVIASGENAEPDTQNYRLDFVNLSEQVGQILFGGAIPFSGNDQCLHFGIFDTGDDRCINIDLSGDSKFSIKPDMGSFIKDTLTVSGTLFSESHIQGKTCNLEHLYSDSSDITDSWVKNELTVGTTSYPSKLTNANGESFRQVIDARLNSSAGGLYINARTRDGAENNVPLLQIDEGIAGGNDPCFVVNSKGNTAVGHKNPAVRLDVQGSPNPLGQNNELVKIGANDGTAEYYLGLGVDALSERCWIRSYRDGAEENLIIQNESTTDGFVGIGKHVPTAKLHVGGNAVVEDDIHDSLGIRFAKVNEIGNGTLTLKDNKNVTLGTFTANQNNNTEIIIETSPPLDPNGGLEETAAGLRIINYGAGWTDGALYTSDEKLKSNVEKIESPISIVNAIDGVRFKWNDLAPPELNDKQDVGVIAQSVQKVLPEAVGVNANSELSVYYHKIIPVLLECIKDQQSQIDSLGKRISDLENG